ncbi:MULTISPECIES: gamma-butyrobetaine hydroxylase-like domain-containing protein [Vitreoscilla]|uniref:DUF971 domain-containing protein n=1 Tax=Vitreoscilla stercoraria TaxID=61 RepID=A0ABY4EJ97_VITST|nr:MULTISPECIES: DUF971 domain-containing protein [Vitreoscilla]AUZ05202.2 hypothetical protein ADP71_16710 [Vitreoscilla sp. C1]UOO93447.1 DUF971 domain-containing protein [Vitreoscilla stercoraria]
MVQMPETIRLDKNKSILHLEYAGQTYGLSAEYLRVHSPSAQVRGHGVGQEVLQTGKRLVTIVGLEMSGNYALKIVYSDGHDSGLYDWAYLHELATTQEAKWQAYEARLAQAGASRDV